MPHAKDPSLAYRLPVNIVILGASSVGKTTVALQFITETKVESGSCKPTIEDSFYKEINLNESEDDSVFKDGPQEKGVECLWKMETESWERKQSTGSMQSLNLITKLKHKGSNNNEIEANDLKMVLNVTDTASYKPSYSARKSLRWRLQRLTLRRRPLATSAPAEVPVRRRYRHNQVKPERSWSSVPSFIYRKGEDGISRHDNHMRTADAILLVYSLKDKTSFEILQDIRSQIAVARGSPVNTSDTPPLRNKGIRSEENENGRKCSHSKQISHNKEPSRLPPIAVIGTNLDSVVPTLSPFERQKVEEEEKSSNESLLNYAFTYKSPHRPGSRRRKFQKQISLAAEVLVEATKPRVPEVTSEHVRGVVGAWPECIGYAEVSNDNIPRVKRVFEHLTLRVIRNRLSSEKKNNSPSYSPRKRLDSAMNIFRRQSSTFDESGDEKSTSCFSFLRTLSCR